MAPTTADGGRELMAARGTARLLGIDCGDDGWSGQDAMQFEEQHLARESPDQ